MYKTRLKKLIEHLEGVPDEQFDMAFFWAKDCGCIAGHASRIFPVSSVLGRSLGISAIQARDLQTPRFTDAHYQEYPGKYGYINRLRAIAVLKNLLETEEVEWSIRA